MQTVERLIAGGYKLNSFDGESWSSIFFVSEEDLKAFFYKKEQESKDGCSS